MGEQDIRWEQRFNNFQKAFAKLSEAVIFVKGRHYVEGKFEESTLIGADDIVIEGLIQRFEYTHELAWIDLYHSAFEAFQSTMEKMRSSQKSN